MADEPRPRIPISADWVLKRIQEGKDVRLKNAVIVGDLGHDKLDLPIRNINQKMKGSKENVKIVKSYIDIFNSTFQGSLSFDILTFDELVFFEGVTFTEFTSFVGANFSKQASFSGANFNKEAWFDGVNFNADVFFDEVIFRGDTHFSHATFGGFIDFYGATFSGDGLTFRDAEFNDPLSQERACRRAKNVLEKNGVREGAGYHFYREMDAQRKQKPWYLRYPEFVFIQLIFGYGVHPFRLMFCWLLVATIFALFYSAKGGILSKLPASTLPQPLSYFVECFYFSIVTAVTPGYGKYELTSWVYQVIASIEAIFGTFMWAAFIATFARKYMR